MKNKLAKIILLINRKGWGAAQVAMDVLILRFSNFTASRTQALAASRLKRWGVARTNWLKLNPTSLKLREIELFAESLVRTKDWAMAARLIEQARGSAYDSVTLELQLAEALWRLDDADGFNAARERAIGLLGNKSPGAVSLIRNENQVTDIPSRLALLKQVELYLEEIKSEAETVEVLDAEPRAYMFWNSGFESAPALVRACHNQANAVYGQELVSLSQANLSQYAELGKHLNRVAKLWPAQYSDVLRVKLMASRGGVWLDSTIFTTENSLHQEKYQGGDFFVFNYNGPRIANWFMVSKAGSYQARMLYAAMNAYWRHNKRLKNYFVFHDMFEVLYHLDPKFKAEFDRSSHIHASPFLRAQSKMLFTECSLATFNDSLNEAPLQKLTYKPGKKPHGKGTLYQQLCQRA